MENITKSEIRLVTKEEIQKIKENLEKLNYILKEDNTVKYHTTLEQLIRNFKNCHCDLKSEEKELILKILNKYKNDYD